MTAHNVANILAIHQLATLTEQQDGITWYPRARAIAKGLADRYGIHQAEAAGVIAALSPRNKWERNVQDAEALISAFVAGGEAQALATKVCTFGANKAKAVKILTAGVLTDRDVLEILSGPKLREFYSCIQGIADVCIDGHAYCIWAGERTGLADVPAIGVKLRREIKADYATAADQVGMTAAALQAITWVTWRRIHGVA
ncbi:N-glycosylase/DNA lyase [Synechococcus phage S-CRES3]|nr:N-glycosylase/DNA lyase [Synechococcus phage S-CRES3]